jgi:thiol-disulfide isomerase/thioredoxin
MEVSSRTFRAPGIHGDYWFNSDPIALGALRGYVVLIDFWDFTSSSSLRALPYIKEWYARYSELGLVVIGVHSPEFPFGRDMVTIRRAVSKLNIRYPVVMDNDFFIWGAFRNRVWPTRYLIDKDGFIRIVQEGEVGYQNFEHSIQSLLVEAGYHGELPLVMDPLRDVDRDGVVRYRVTPGILTGYQRGTIGNVEGFSPESVSHFEDPGYYLEGRLYLHGNWLNDRNFLKLEESDGREGFIMLSYRAKELNSVIKPEGEKQFQVFVQQDRLYLTTDNMGDDVQIDGEGRSYLLVDQPKLYNVVKNKEYGEHTLKLSSRSNGFAVYSISFVSSVIPEMVSNN